MDSKKKVFIIIPSMTMGGGEMSLINFVRNLKEDFEIEVGLFSKTGELLQTLEDEGVSVFQVSDNASYHSPHKPVAKIKRYKRIIKKLLEISFIGRVVISKRRKILHKEYEKNREEYVKTWLALTKEYDVAIAYNIGCWYMKKFVLDNAKAKHKFGIIHNDLRRKNLADMGLMFDRFDKILSVSNSINAQFQQFFPAFADKGGVLKNFMDTEKIIIKAEEEKVALPNKFKLVSVSRLSQEKAYPRVLSVLCKLKKEGYDFHWTIVGDGPERETIERLIEKHKLGNDVTIMGYKTNPYPYIKAADLIMLNSYHEAAPVVYGEAMTLGVPVFTTNVVSAKELVGEQGFVCGNSEEEIYKGLKGILTDKQKTLAMKEKIKNYEYPNEEIRQKFLELVK